MRRGLHDYLTEFLEQVYELGNLVSRDFLVPLAPAPAPVLPPLRRAA